MSEERLDYAILISLAMREEAEVMASALRAEGIDAFVGNAHHVNVDWGWTIALGGMQVFVPRQKIQDAKAIIRERMAEAREHPEGEPVGRRDRWKVWAVIAGTIGLNVYVGWVNSIQQASFAPQASSSLMREPDNFWLNTDRAFCEENPDNTVIRYRDGERVEVPCAEILR